MLLERRAASSKTVEDLEVPNDFTYKPESAIWRRYRDVVARLLKPNRDSNVITGNGSIIAPSGRQSRGKVEHRVLK